MTTTKTIKCGNCKGTHGSAAEVRQCHQGVRDDDPITGNPFAEEGPSAEEFAAMRTGVIAEPMATEKQRAFLATLVAELAHLTDPDTELTAADFEPHFTTLTKAAASTAIGEAIERRDAAKKEAKAKGVQHEVLEDGVYQRPNGEIVKVHHTVHGANRQVGSVLKVECIDGKYKGEFIYGGMRTLAGLTAAMLLDEEAARQLGILYGFCVRCSRTLTRAESQFVGYGKTCAGHQGWWYPSKAELKELLAKAEDPTKVVQP